jgi:D-cysteine desulfhydrase/L-cysteate sulfo-lyase
MFDVASAVAYLETTMEMLEQLRAMGTTPTVLYMSSSGKGQAGLELARALWGGFRVHGVTATREFDVPPRTAAIANEAAGALGLDVTVRPEDVVNFDDFVGPGYGRPSPEGTEAVRLFARTEALVLDPVYTGKCAAALIAHARAGRLTGDDTVVFVHTGGAPAIFTWSHLWTDDGADAPDGRP